MPHVTADVYLTPIGTNTTSISSHIAAAEKILRDYPDLEVQLNPMSTSLSGELDRVLEAVRRMHEAPFAQGVKRVSTTLRIDDRRDIESSGLQRRVQAVHEKMDSH